MTDPKISKSHRWPPELFEAVENHAKQRGLPIQTILDECLVFGLLQRSVEVPDTEKVWARWNPVTGNSVHVQPSPIDVISITLTKFGPSTSFVAAAALQHGSVAAIYQEPEARDQQAFGASWDEESFRKAVRAEAAEWDEKPETIVWDWGRDNSEDEPLEQPPPM
jgi:hypothetical protein